MILGRGEASMRRILFAAMLAAAVAAALSAQADDQSDDGGRKLMMAAAVVLGQPPVFSGQPIRVQSPSHATMEGNHWTFDRPVDFEKIADCIYRMEEAGWGNTTINFKDLTGRYSTRDGDPGETMLTLIGNDPKTWCLTDGPIPGQGPDCRSHMVWSDSASEVYRVLHDLAYIQKTACPFTNSPDPF